MNPLLSNLGYSLDPNTRVWLKADCESIAYNDGDEIENRITSAITQSTDVSLFSLELKKHCIDWPSLYHLSAARANILRPFRSLFPGADVLEIGSGCGAITRYLGECEANVLALEGTLRRAVITRARTRDLNNVEVVCEQFHKFAGSHKFDVITLIGVLEYANLFMPGERPIHNMLEQVKSMLKSDGRLIIAIENQLGLKYFAGAPEDHHGQPLYGIEGRYKDKQPTTYGRRTLKRHLHQAGFIENHFFAPFPDYKLPLSIISQRGFSSQEFDPGMLVTHGVRADPQLPPHLFFSPELVWPVVLKNELGLDLANSFLIVAQTSKIKSPSSEVLAYHYSTHRAKPFCKETLFLQTENGNIEVQCNLLEPNTIQNTEDQSLSHVFERRAEYIKGKLLSCDFIDIVIRDGWSIEELGLFFKKYLSIVASLISKNNPINEIGIDTLLPGNSIDLTPINIIIRQNGEPYAIDQEWGWNNSFSVGFIIFRSLLWLNNIISCYGKPDGTVPDTLLGLFLALYKEMGFEISEEKIQSYYELEALFQSKVAQDKVVMPHMSSSLRTSNLNQLITNYANYQNIESALIEKDHHIRNLEYIVTDKDKHIENLEHIFSEKDHHIRNLESMFDDKDRHIRNLEHIFAEKEGHIRNLENMVDDKDKHIENLEHIFAEKEGHIRNLENMADDKDRHIENLEHIFAEKKGHIRNLENMVDDKDKHIENLEHIFAEKEGHIRNLENMVDDKDKHIENLEHIFAEKEGHIRNLENMVDDKDKHIENLEHIFAEKEGHIRNLENMVDDKDKHIENLEHIFAEKEGHIR
ncbi:class I SAM-dependent methyltransferase, partial [Legionella sainthelensi]|uniref:class I SAM-dependent methyltransferase n=1 Tax=Legionella sainthelensi TaxID=28087 RepID=UPI000E20022C